MDQADRNGVQAMKQQLASQSRSRDLVDLAGMVAADTTSDDDVIQLAKKCFPDPAGHDLQTMADAERHAAKA